MEVKVKKLNKDAVIPYKTYERDFCYDVVATSCEEVAPNVYKYGIGLAFEVDRHKMTYEDGVRLIQNCFNIETTKQHTFVGRAGIKYDESKINISIDLRPRSSVWKTGMVLSNCTGTIDELYRGEVCAVFYHLMPNMPKYEVGDKIGQIKLGFTLPINFVEVEELSETERGSGGYGSTGK
jgi:dUTP pyrophosphatase